MDPHIRYWSRLSRYLSLAVLLVTAAPVSQVAAADYLLGKFVRADLLTNDLDAAAKFYGQVFGWRLDRHDAEGYIDASVHGRPVATLASYTGPVAPNAQALWLASISVADVDPAVSTATGIGGKVLERAQDVSGIGRAAVIEDPTGGVVMLLRSEDRDPADAPAAENEWLWPELWTDRPDAAAQFYETVVGYKVVRHKDPDGDDLLILGRDGIARATILRTPLPDVESNWLLYLKVKNVHTSARAVIKHGGAVLLPPSKGGLNDDIAIVADPTGGVFAIQGGGDES